KTEPDTPGCIQNNMPPVPGVVSVPVPTVPIRNSMPLKTEQWYFRKMSRIEAEKYLLSHVNSHRSMIIRGSETSKNAYSLSVRYGNIVYHYRIKKIHSSFFIVENIKFKNLRGLVEHYSKVLSKLQASGVEPDKPPTENQSENVNHCDVKKHVTNGYVSHSFVPQWNYLLQYNPLNTLKNLCNGQFGTWTNKAPVAIKLKTTEMRVMKMLRPIKLIQLYDNFNKREPIYFITELMKNGSLFDFLQDKGLSLNLQKLIYTSVQKGRNIYHLEYKNYIHLTVVMRYDLIEKIIL
ncbi:hypothetical protein AGLY_003398, partial [Aphis glycines]